MFFSFVVLYLSRIEDFKAYVRGDMIIFLILKYNNNNNMNTTKYTINEYLYKYLELFTVNLRDA